MKFFTGNEWYWRLARTFVQAILGVLIAELDLIVDNIVIDPSFKPIVVALVMNIISPIMAQIKNHKEVD